MIYRIGKIYGLLKVIALDPTKKRKYYYCKCACGNVVSVRSSDFNRTTSCGCLLKEIRLKRKEKNKSLSFGTSKERLAYYKQTRDLFEEIRNRDSNKCVLCNKENNLHVHHILRKSTHPRYMLQPENLVTLCSSCHLWEAHAGNTNSSNFDCSVELLSIVFNNTMTYTINQEVIDRTIAYFI